MNPIVLKVLIGIGLLVAAVGGYKAWEIHEQALGANAALTAKTVELDKLYRDADTKRQTAEDKLKQFLTERNIQDAKNKATITALSNKLASMQLRDPNATSSGGKQTETPSSPNGSGNNPTETSGVLSVQLTELLRKLMRESDEINNAYNSCRATLYNDRKEQ